MFPRQEPSQSGLVPRRLAPRIRVPRLFRHGKNIQPTNPLKLRFGRTSPSLCDLAMSVTETGELGDDAEMLLGAMKEKI